MIRFASLQFRIQAAVAFAALAVMAVILALTGPHLVHLYNTTVATCGAHGNCSSATATFPSSYRLLQDLGNVVIVVPAIIGVFWGAPPVARELETGTHRLVWTQSVTRTHWIAVKLGVVGLASMVVAGLFSLMVTWWSSPIDRVNVNQFPVFAERGIVPIGYAAFAFALGVTAGVVIRRTLPAMASALAGFVVARVVVTYAVRPNLEAPVHLNSALHLTSGM
jgi:ABC-type transport system involved in multi-copper enzyme maturation permease subunit